MKVLVILLLTTLLNVHGFLFPKVKPVKELITAKYLGRWYEAYSSLIQRKTFQKDSFCTTATYSVISNTTLKVYNAGRLKSATGKLYDINGTAVLTQQPGALIVNFPGSPQSKSANYIVIKLGPATFGKEGRYEYTIISSSRKTLVWILVRDPKTFKAKYEKEALAYLKANGFTWFWNKPRVTYQGDDCLYPPM